ncbi:MAG: hypothetical protein NC355_00750 [Blautia sp.]|nr:hypothetical protein [Blautia sp.]
MDAGDVLKVSLEGDDSEQLNGRLSSMILADTNWIMAVTTEGKLFLLQPFPDFYFPENSEVKYCGIAEGCKFDNVSYASQHFAYGDGHLVYFEIISEYADKDIYMLDSLELPEMVYTAENVKQTDLQGSRSLLLVNDEAKCCVYVDADGNVCAAYGDSVDSDVEFAVDDARRGQMLIQKGIYRFALTDSQELLYINRMNATGNLSGTEQEISLDSINLTGRIEGKVVDIYSCRNYEDSCYAVDEDNNIYYIENSWLEDDVTVELITRFENGSITDIQGFSGEHEDILIQADGDYYYHNTYNGIQKIKLSGQNYKSVVLLMDGNILALGNDGFLYMVQNPAA